MRVLSSSDSIMSGGVSRPSRAERRAAARGKNPVEAPRSTPMPGRGNVVHDRGRYAIRRRG